MNVCGPNGGSTLGSQLGSTPLGDAHPGVITGRFLAARRNGDVLGGERPNGRKEARRLVPIVIDRAVVFVAVLRNDLASVQARAGQ